jgi:hypothetical protein
MTVEELRLALADPMTPDRFRQLRADLATWDPSELFETLLRFALDTEPSNPTFGLRPYWSNWSHRARLAARRLSGESLGRG